MTQCVQLDLFAGDGSSTAVFRICPKEAYNSDLRDFIELCGGIVLEPGGEDPCVINIVDIDWMMKNHRALLKTARFPDDHFLPNFIYDCYETKKVQNLNKYRLGGSAYETYDANEILLRVKSWNDLELKEVDDDEEETNNAWDDVRNNNLECASNSSEKENIGNHHGEAPQPNGIRVEMTSNQELLLRNHLDGTADELTVSTGPETIEEELILPEEMLTGWSARANRTEQTEEIATKKANKNMLNLFGVPDFQDELTSGDKQNENVRSKRKRGRELGSKKAVESDTANPKRLKKKTVKTGQGQRLTRKKLKSLRAAKDVIELSESDSDTDSVIKPRAALTRFQKKPVPDESDEQEETEVLPKRKNLSVNPPVPDKSDEQKDTEVLPKRKNLLVNPPVSDESDEQEETEVLPARKNLLVNPSRIAKRGSCNGDGNLNGTSLAIEDEESDDFDPPNSPVRKKNLFSSPTKSKTVSLREDSELVISPIHTTPRIRTKQIYSDSSSEDNAAQNKSRSRSSSSSNFRVNTAETANRRAPSKETEVVNNSDESELNQSFKENRNNKGSKALVGSQLKSSRALRKPNIPTGKAKSGAATDSVRRNVRGAQKPVAISSSDSESQSDSEGRIPNPKKASLPKLHFKSMEIDSDEDLEYSDSEACPYCSFKANDVKKVAEHVSKRHDNRHKCKDCEFSTTLAYKLRLHRAKTHQ